MSLKSKIEAIIYAAEEPVTLDHIVSLLKDEIEAQHNAALEAVAAATEPAPTDASAEAATETAPPAEPPKLNAKETVRACIEVLIEEYAGADRGMEIRHVAGGYRMATKPEHHDVVRAFAKSLKPAIRLSLQALETLAVIAYKQPVTVPEISEIRGVDSSGVIGTLLDRKVITTAGRKQVIGRPILYKTTKEFLLRFGLKDVSELPSMEEFEKLVSGDTQQDLFSADRAPEVPDEDGTEEKVASPES